jgi:hypothetical protein
MLVPTKVDGVPKFGVVNVGEVERTTVLPLPVVVAAEIAVPFPASTGELIVVLNVRIGSVPPLDVPAKPFEDETPTVLTEPPPPPDGIVCVDKFYLCGRIGLQQLY